MRWYLLIAIFLSLAVLGAWALLRARGTGGRRQARLLGRRSTSAPPLHSEEDEAAYAETLADLSGLVRESRQGGEAETLAAAEPRRRAGARRRHPSQMDLGFDDEGGTAPGVALEERVVAMYLKAPEGQSFGGEDLQQALAAVDLRFGEMAIFHHYGIGKLYAPRPLFSVANMFEPGTIEIDNIDDFSTQGLAFFLRVPARVESSLVFELMLNTAQRLAERLGGELLDDTRAPLTTQAIGHLRKLVKEYDPR